MTSKLDKVPPERPSKTQRKLQMLALQKMGEKLVSLPAAQCQKIILDPLLADAIAAAREITSHEGKRRQLQYIGRLMRNVDPVPIQAALEKLELKSRESKAHFHQVERWRDKLIANDDNTLHEFLEQFGITDRQYLRQLVRNAKKGVTGSEKELFRYLRDLINN